MSTSKKPNQLVQCAKCHSPENLKSQRLCEQCEIYANQDYVSQREVPEPNRTLDRQQANLHGLSLNAPWSPSSGPPGVPDFDKILTLLTAKQAELAELRFRDGLSFRDIAEKLGISLSSTQRLWSRTKRRIEGGYTNLHIVREQVSKANGPNSLSDQSAANSPLDPYQFYSGCPRCGHLDLVGDATSGQCLGCGWKFVIEKGTL